MRSHRPNVPQGLSHAEATCPCILHNSPNSLGAEGPAPEGKVPRTSWGQTLKVPPTSVNKSRLAGTKLDSGN